MIQNIAFFLICWVLILFDQFCDFFLTPVLYRLHVFSPYIFCFSCISRRHFGISINVTFFTRCLFYRRPKRKLLTPKSAIRQMIHLKIARANQWEMDPTLPCRLWRRRSVEVLRGSDQWAFASTGALFPFVLLSALYFELDGIIQRVFVCLFFICLFVCPLISVF